MTNKCTVCSHPQHSEIDTHLLKGTAVRILSEQFQLSVAAINRHKYNKHIPQAVARAAQSNILPASDSIIDQIQELRDQALVMLEEAESVRDKTALLKEIREQIKLLADIMLKKIELDRDSKADVITVNLTWDD